MSSSEGPGQERAPASGDGAGDGRAARQRRDVAEVGAAVARAWRLPPVLDVVLDQTIRTLGARVAHVFLADEERRTLELVAQRNLPPPLLEKLARVSFDAPLLAARAASSREPQLVRSLDELDPVLLLAHELLEATGTCGMVAMPLVAHERLVGVLTFATAEPLALGAEEEAALRECAEIFAFGIQNAVTYEEERRLRSLFEAVARAGVAIAGALELEVVLQQIVDEARVVAAAEYAALGVMANEDAPFDPWVYSGMTRAQAAAIGHAPRPVGLLGAVAREGRSLRVADVVRHPSFRGLPAAHPPLTSVLGVPIRFEERAVGNLYLANKRGAPEFTEADARAIELLAAHAGAAIHQSRLRAMLDDERAKLKAIVDNAPHGVIFVEAATGARITNPRAAELTGLAGDNIAALEGRILAPDGAPLAREDWPISRALRGERIRPQEVLMVQPDGTRLPVRVSVAPVRDGGLVGGAVALLEDISAQKELERLREDWAALVTHDLRQPLSVMQTYSDVIRRLAQRPDPERLAKAIDHMQGGIGRLNRMIADLGDVSRIESRQLALETKPTDLVELLRLAAERHRLTARERSIELSLGCERALIDVDPMRIEQVLDNLVTNALKYSRPATVVRLAIEEVEGGLRLSVINDGEGITPDEVPRLFDRYYRTTRARRGGAEGLGLGLYIVKGLVEAHGGRVWVESRVGETTSFHVFLPAAPAERAPR